MINLLFTVVFAEIAVILTLSFRTPLRKLLILGLDLSKQGKGPLVAKTVAATLLVVFVSVISNVIQIQKRAGVVSSTDEVLIAKRILEASMMGFAFFHAIMIDRLHYYIKELDLLRQELVEVKSLNRKQKNPEEHGGDRVVERTMIGGVAE